MKRILLSFVTMTLTAMLNARTNSGDVPKYLDTTLDFEVRTNDLVSQMTLEERIS